MKKGNKWRRRIIRVLETLLKDLQSRPPGPTQSEVINKLAGLSDRADCLKNGLEDVEIADSLYYTRSIPIPRADDGVLYTLKDCLEDTAFAVYCCMQDATYLRLFSANVWRQFGLGGIGVQTATFCTNNVYAQLGRMSEQLRRTFDHLNNDNWMTRMHTKIDGFMRRYVANDMAYTDTHPNTVDPPIEDVSLARNTSRRLGFYASTLLCSQLTRLIHEVVFAQERRRPVDTVQETRLLKSLVQLRCLEWCDNTISDTFKTDCMYDAAMALMLGHMDTEALFAAQMLFDIQMELNARNLPLEDMLETLSLEYLRLYQRYDAEWMNEGLDGNHCTRATRMHDQFDILRHVVHSNSNVQVDLEHMEHATPRQYPVERFNIVRQVPLFIGQMAAQFHEEFHDTFLDIANDRGHILTASHFYNAAKRSGSLPLGMRWDDMEWVIDHQVDLGLYEDSPEGSGSKYLKHFCDTYGLDQSKFKMNTKPMKPEQARNDIHLIGRSPKRLEDCSRYVRACSEFKGLHRSKPGEWRLRMMQAFADCQLDAFSAHGSPHSIGLLIAAKEMCEYDEEALGFDIFAFHMTCTKLLSSIRRTCFENAPDDYPSARYDGLEGLNTTIAELLRDLQSCPRHHDSMWNEAVRLLEDVIKREGSACEDMAFERLKMLTVDFIGVDSDDSRSDTMSPGFVRAAVETPQNR